MTRLPICLLQECNITGVWLTYQPFHPGWKDYKCLCVLGPQGRRMKLFDTSMSLQGENMAVTSVHQAMFWDFSSIQWYYQRPSPDGFRPEVTSTFCFISFLLFALALKLGWVVDNSLATLPVTTVNVNLVEV